MFFKSKNEKVERKKKMSYKKKISSSMNCLCSHINFLFRSNGVTRLLEIICTSSNFWMGFSTLIIALFVIFIIFHLHSFKIISCTLWYKKCILIISEKKKKNTNHVRWIQTHITVNTNLLKNIYCIYFTYCVPIVCKFFETLTFL